MTHDHTVDIRGLCCAQPIIILAREMRGRKEGDVILAVSDKMSMLNDISAFCKETKNTLVSQEEKDNLYYFRIRKGMAPIT